MFYLSNSNVVCHSKTLFHTYTYYTYYTLWYMHLNFYFFWKTHMKTTIDNMIRAMYQYTYNLYCAMVGKLTPYKMVTTPRRYTTIIKVSNYLNAIYLSNYKLTLSLAHGERICVHQIKTKTIKLYVYINKQTRGELLQINNTACEFAYTRLTCWKGLFYMCVWCILYIYNVLLICIYITITIDDNDDVCSTSFASQTTCKLIAFGALFVIYIWIIYVHTSVVPKTICVCPAIANYSQYTHI